MQNNIFHGAGFLFLGFTWLFKKGLKRYVLIPLVINIVLFSVLIWFSGHYFSHFVAWLDSELPSWLRWLNWILWPIFVITISLLVVYTFTIIANLVGAPFNSFLSEKVELLYANKKVNEGDSVWDSAKDVPRSIRMQIRLLTYIIPRFIALIIFMVVAFFIPLLNLVASVLWFVFNAWYMGLQYLNYPMDNNKFTFPEMLKECRDMKWNTLGFGVLTMFASLVPGLNFFVMPAAVIGATMMYCGDDAHSLRQLPVTQ